jgi:hypothetical protein
LPGCRSCRPSGSWARLRHLRAMDRRWLGLHNGEYAPGVTAAGNAGARTKNARFRSLQFAIGHGRPPDGLPSTAMRVCIQGRPSNSAPLIGRQTQFCRVKIQRAIGALYPRCWSGRSLQRPSAVRSAKEGVSAMITDTARVVVLLLVAICASYLLIATFGPVLLH